MVIEGSNLFPDNWIYAHSPEVKMARIANYGSFSPKMAADGNTTIITVEYFCFAGDDYWSKGDDELLKLARDEMKTIGLLGARKVKDGFVI